MSKIEGFRELKVYRMTHRHVHTIFERSQHFSKEGKYASTDQIRRSSRAVTALLAEASWREYRAAFINKVNQALGEAMEIQSWLDHARSCGYLNEDEYAELDDSWAHIGAMLRRM